ncbi:MAG: hypothetical protein M3279_01340 [Actinomycetota bacterium]|nr:hypothetical protein [Actinomycetota bacterium]
MAETRLPTEVELAYEVMSCQAMRVAQEPESAPHPCTYFRKWGTYHSYDYSMDAPPPERGIVHETRYVGRAPLVPELLSGCRKAPIMALGINPNLPGWWRGKKGSLNPLFDDYRQYAHYFRYRSLAKLELSREDYERFGGDPDDTPFTGAELDVPADANGDRTIEVRLQPQKMYEAYQELLDALAERMGWPDHELTVGEDVTYGNMVASPSAKWTTYPSDTDPLLPPMTVEERNGIVSECFHTRKYFLRQLFQSLPSVLLIFSQSTANAFNGEMQTRFSRGRPKPTERLEDLMKREVRLKYGDLPSGETLDARVIYAPHITGNPKEFGPSRERVIAALVEEAEAGRISYNPATKHLSRPPGGCVFCPMLEIGPCDYVEELTTISSAPELTADSPVANVLQEKLVQTELLGDVAESGPPLAEAWAESDDAGEPTGEE